MRRISILLVLSGLLLSLTAGAAWAKIVVGDLTHVPPGVESFFPQSDQTVETSIRDAREDQVLLAGALIGPKADQGKGTYLGYSPAQPGALVSYMERASSDALGVLGVESGAGGLGLEIVIEELRVDMYRVSGFSPMNCMLYARIRSIVRGLDGELTETEHRLALFDTTTPVGSMKEVSREALSRLFSYAAWQITSASLIDHLSLTPMPDEVEQAAGGVAAVEESDLAHNTLFWIGLAGHRSGSIEEGLMLLFRDAEEQGHRQAAVETLGMLEAEAARPEFEELLEGSRSTEQWDMEDNEQIWYLLRGLHLLGASDLEERIPRNDEIKMRSKLVELVLFQEKGEIPELGPEARKKEEKAIAKGRKKGKIR